MMLQRCCRVLAILILTDQATSGACFRHSPNATSKARSRGNERAIDILAQQALVERQSRENWQDKHSPSTVQYVDVQTGAGAFSGSNANAAAAALAYNQNFGVNSAIGGCNYLRVARVSGSKLCGCDGCDAE